MSSYLNIFKSSMLLTINGVDGLISIIIYLS